MKLYHITPKKYIKSIFRIGLRPRYKNGLTSYKNEINAVFLTDNPTFIKQNYAGKNWCKICKPIILEIDCSDLELTNNIICDAQGKIIKIPHEYLYFGTIETNRIKIKKE